MKNQRTEIERYLKEGNSIQIAPKGNSMYPFLIEGRDEVVIKQMPHEQLKKGDVVLYRRKEGILVLHRMIGKKPDGVYMIGDNQVEIEGPIDEEQILGKMTHFVRNGKRVSVKEIRYRICSKSWLLLRPLRKLFRRWKRR